MLRGSIKKKFAAWGRSIVNKGAWMDDIFRFTISDLYSKPTSFLI